MPDFREAAGLPINDVAVKITITTLDGEVLEQFVAVEVYTNPQPPVVLAREVLSLIEDHFATREP